MGKVFLLLIVAALAVLCWWKIDVIRGFLKSDKSADADNKSTPVVEIRTPAGVRASNGTVAREITAADIKSYLTVLVAELLSQVTRLLRVIKMLRKTPLLLNSKLKDLIRNTFSLGQQHLGHFRQTLLFA